MLGLLNHNKGSKWANWIKKFQRPETKQKKERFWQTTVQADKLYKAPSWGGCTVSRGPPPGRAVRAVARGTNSRWRCRPALLLWRITGLCRASAAASYSASPASSSAADREDGPLEPAKNKSNTGRSPRTRGSVATAVTSDFCYLTVQLLFLLVRKSNGIIRIVC